MSRRRFLLAAAGLGLGCRSRTTAFDSPTMRVVSLAPAVTETLFAIGAGKAVIGVSDYCETPAEARERPRLGTSITPNYEAIARLKPNLIVSEKNAASRRRELEALARTVLLPWLTLSEIDSGIRELGRLTHHSAEADAVALRLVQKLNVPEPALGPRVLLVLGEAGEEIWFIRNNSLHGKVLHAAGAKNAVVGDVLGPPNLSAERLLALDPDAIVVLVAPSPGAAKARFAAARFARFTTLRAVRSGRVGSVEDAAAFSHGPSIVQLVDRLHAELTRLGAVR